MDGYGSSERAARFILQEVEASPRGISDQQDQRLIFALRLITEVRVME